MKSKAGSFPTPMGWQPQAWQEALALAARLPRPLALPAAEVDDLLMHKGRSRRRPRHKSLRNKKGSRHARR